MQHAAKDSTEALECDADNGLGSNGKRSNGQRRLFIE